MTQLLPPKKDVALALLERSNVDVYLDPRSEGVVVPPQFRKEPRLILKIGLNMHVPIPDLRVDDDSMSCTLSFSRTPFYCVVPWSSVFAMVGEDGRGMVWPDDVPQELAVKPDGSPKSPPAKEGGPKVALAPAPSSASGGEGLRSAGGRSPRRSKLADASAPSSTGKNKRTKKKKDEGRPVLMAVPAPAPSAPALTEKAARLVPESASESKLPSKPSIGSSRPSDDVAPAPAASSSEAASPESVIPKTPSRAPTSTPSGPGSGRPKRELPPYLRVVK